MSLAQSICELEVRIHFNPYTMVPIFNSICPFKSKVHISKHFDAIHPPTKTNHYTKFQVDWSKNVCVRDLKQFQW